MKKLVLSFILCERKEGLKEHGHPAREGEGPGDSELSHSDDDDGVGRVRESVANELPEGLAFLSSFK